MYIKKKQVQYEEVVSNALSLESVKGFQVMSWKQSKSFRNMFQVEAAG